MKWCYEQKYYFLWRLCAKWCQGGVVALTGMGNMQTLLCHQQLIIRAFVVKSQCKTKVNNRKERHWDKDRQKKYNDKQTETKDSDVSNCSLCFWVSKCNREGKCVEWIANAMFNKRDMILLLIVVYFSIVTTPFFTFYMHNRNEWYLLI